MMMIDNPTIDGDFDQHFDELHRGGYCEKIGSHQYHKIYAEWLLHDRPKNYAEFILRCVIDLAKKEIEPC